MSYFFFEIVNSLSKKKKKSWGNFLRIFIFSVQIFSNKIAEIGNTKKKSKVNEDKDSKKEETVRYKQLIVCLAIQIWCQTVWTTRDWNKQLIWRLNAVYMCLFTKLVCMCYKWADKCKHYIENRRNKNDEIGNPSFFTSHLVYPDRVIVRIEYLSNWGSWTYIELLLYIYLYKF